MSAQPHSQNSVVVYILMEVEQSKRMSVWMHMDQYMMDRGQCEHEVYNLVQWNPYKLQTLQLFG